MDSKNKNGLFSDSDLEQDADHDARTLEDSTIPVEANRSLTGHDYASAHHCRHHSTTAESSVFRREEADLGQVNHR